MFDVQDVSLSYGERVILQNASFKVEDGERAAIIGPNGTGKSTLLKIIAGTIRQESGQISIPKNTQIGYLPQDIELNSSRTVLEECRTVFEVLLRYEQEMRELEGKMAEVDPESAEFDTIADRYEFLLHETQRRDLYSMDSTIGRVLDGLGFKVEDQERPCDEFSGGWQMRIALAKLLLQNPETLLLDEPTNHLDIESIEWLASWIKTHEGSVLMVSHERAFMDTLVTKVLEIDRANLFVYRGNYSESLIKRAERREHHRRTFENQQREIQHVQKFVDRFRYQASKAALVQSRIKQLEKIERIEAPLDDQGTIHFKFPPASRSAKEVLIATGIGKVYGDKRVLRGIDLTVFRGEKIALVGVNGAGKTTLMRILAGRDGNHEGSFSYGASVEHAYFAQYDKEDLHPNNTVLGEFLSTAPLSVSEKARGILGAFLFSGDDVQKSISVLSGGERTRLRLAKMLCGNANLLMLDEPTNHLDIGSRLTLEEALRQYEGSVLLVSHDRYFLDNVVTRVVEISDGSVASYPGNYSEYLSLKELQGAGDPGTATAGPRPAGETPHRIDADALADQIRSTPRRETPEQRRARQEREKKAKNRLRKAESEMKELEDALFELEELVGTLENELADPAVAADYEKSQTLTEKLTKVTGKKGEVETKWLELEEEITALREETGG
ncbi:MAG: ABC-F family ATP-binding cassette domain-containing protein [Candidatus Sumerlaeia bacterium]|nr:ABC-F family ATP-binding cassette domain-containing protein [Candidatus Sumerlaeia bacterium]